MANGRVLPSALLFDWLLGRAWNMAMNSYANAERFSSVKLGSEPAGRGVVFSGGGPSIERFLSRYAGDEPAALVTAHDRLLQGQMAEVARTWARGFQGVIGSAAPMGPGFALAVQWLQGVTNGRDGLGYLGVDHRAAQAAQYVSAVAGAVNGRGLPLPAGALAALRATATREAGLHAQRAQAQMQADRLAERHRLRIDAAEALLRAHGQALDAAMEHTFTQMHLMFDVFGRNNDYLSSLQREEQAIKARLEIRSAQLAGWAERIQTRDDSAAAAIRKSQALAGRANARDGMSAEAHIRLLRRFSSRAAAALNSAGVSVNSTASESNNVDAGG